MKQRIWKRWLSVLIVASLLLGTTGTAFAWDVSQNAGGWSTMQVTLDGAVNANGAFAISVDGQNWRHTVYLSEIFHQQYDPMGNPMPQPVYPMNPSYTCSLPAVSFDPSDYAYLFPSYAPFWPAGAYSANIPNLPLTVCHTQENAPNVYAQTSGDMERIQHGVLFLRRDIWETYSAWDTQDFWQYFQIHGGFTDGLHVMVDLRYLQNAYATQGSAATIPPYVILGQPYTPLRVTDFENGGVWQDMDGDGVCSAAEIQSGLALGSPVQPGDPVNQYQADVNNIPGGMVIPVPILMWNEGQTQSSGMPGEWQPPLSIIIDSTQNRAAPIDYGTVTSFTTGSTYFGIIGLNPNMMQMHWQYSTSDPICDRNPILLQLMQDTGFMLEESSQTLFLPHTLDGMPVQALGSDLFRDVWYNPNCSPIQTIVVPNSVQYLGDNLFDWSRIQAPIGRMHVPAGVQFDAPFWNDTVTTVCTSVYDANMEAYCQANNVAYEVCAGHIPLHTHTFSSVVTPSTYHTAGYTTFTCACGGSYTVQGSAALSAPTISLQGGSMTPGDTADVTVAVNDNAGLDGITLMPQYDPQTLTLEAVNAVQGLTAAIVPDANGGLPTVTVTPSATFTGTALCTLVFRAASDAAAGRQTVQMTASLTPPAAHADPTPLTLSAAQTDVEVLPAPAPALTVQGGAGTPGSLIPVTVRLQNNTGLTSLLMKIDYDPAALELVRVDDGGLFGTGGADNPCFVAGHDLTERPYTVCWSDDNALQDHTQDGDLAVIWFRVRTQAQPGTYAVSVSAVDHSTLNVALDTVAVTAGAGSVQVNALTGDTNGDGVINAADAMLLRQYLLNPAAHPIAAANADMNGDGLVTEDDVTLLCQYTVGGYNVTLP